MSVIKTTRLFNGLRVEEFTNTVTGEIQLKSKDGDLLATSSSKNYTFNNKSKFIQLYNNAQRQKNKPVLSEKEFTKEFNNNGRTLFDNDRAAVLNNNSSEDNRRAFIEKSIPRIKDPTDGIETNSQGVKTTTPIDGEEEQTQDPESTTPATPTGTSADSTFNDRRDDAVRAGSIGRGDSLKYPQYDLSKFGYDYIKIERFKYSPRIAAILAGQNPNEVKLSGGDSGQRLSGSALDRVFLPMQPSLSESNSVEWGGDKINQIQSAAAGLAIKGISDLSEVNNFGDFTSAVKNLFGGALLAGDEFLKDPNTKYALKAYFAGQAVGANILSRATGTVLNPNLELLFNGPKLRTFSFNFTFTPRNDDEAKTIKKIIRVFKTGMAPATSTSNLFLYTPDIFKLEYIYDADKREEKAGEKHPYMNRIKPCALTQFNVNYTPSNVYMTYKTGSMTQYTVQMQFAELEPIYQKDQKDSIGTGF